MDNIHESRNESRHASGMNHSCRALHRLRSRMFALFWLLIAGFGASPALVQAEATCALQDGVCMCTVDVTTGTGCRTTSWSAITELGSISSISQPDTSRNSCSGGDNDCWVAIRYGAGNSNQWQSRYCNGWTATATGPAADPDACGVEPTPVGDGSIAQSPLFLTSSVEPNILYILDDSLSMDLSYLPDDIEDDSSTKRAKSSTYNSLYYDPNVTYTPPVDHESNSLGNASFTAAKTNGFSSGSSTVNLSTSFRPTWGWSGSYAGSAEAAYYYVFDETNSCSASSVTLTWQGPYGKYDNNEHTYTISALSVITGMSRAGGSGTSCGGYGDWGYNAGTNTIYTDGNCSNVYFNITGTPAGDVCSCVDNTENDDCYDKVVVSETSGVGGTDERTNFANWYSYYRTRMLTAKTGSSLAFATIDEWPRVGYGKINQDSNTVDNESTSTLQRGVRSFGGDDREDFFDWLFGVNAEDYTPLRRALDDAGQYFTREDDRGPYSTTPGSVGGTNISCRQNYTVLMTDGYWNSSQAGTSNARNNNDGTDGPTITGPEGLSYTYEAVSPFTDNYSNTLADVAMYYWKNDLAPNLTNNVPTTTTNPAFWQHMVTFGVGLGVPTQNDYDDVLDAITTGAAITWPDPEVGDSSLTDLPEGRADELLHAGINSRGGFFNASDANAFSSGLTDTLSTIIARIESSATSAAASSAVLQTDTLLYRAGFRSADWSGSLKAYHVESDGSLGSLAWDAEAQLRSVQPANRKLFTIDSESGDGVAFLWANLSPDQQAALNRDAANTVDSLGSARVSWLRGDDDADASFRTRSTTGELRLLGDIINSHPQYVGTKHFGYDWLAGDEGEEYLEFRASDEYNGRPSMIYTGANDGFLHAFEAETGDELFAFMPSELLLPESGSNNARVSRLMDTLYVDNHRYFVDGTMAVGDAYFGADGWKTVLVGTMGAGGRTVFALDVSDPTNFSAADILWEFTDADLGEKVGQPEILRMANGEWAAVFGNGYDGTSQAAHLFIVRLTDGQLIAKLDTGAGDADSPNGLGPTFSTDWPDGDLVVNHIFAGDQLGNLWRFDVGDADEANWGAPQLLFTATDPDDNPQPITAAPWLGTMPSDWNTLMVFFGTGSYFLDTDATSVQVQSLYGIVNSNTTITGRDELLEQTIDWQGTATFGEDEDARTYRVRAISGNTWASEEAFKGWYLDLIYADEATGERVISPPEPPSGALQNRVRFTSFSSDADPCGTGRIGWLTDISMATGGNTGSSVFDFSQDGSYGDDDEVTVGESSYVISGIGGTQGEPLTVIRSDSSSTDHLYGGGNIGDEGFEDGFSGSNTASPTGRQSWRQLR